jgi:hypothetical protein
MNTEFDDMHAASREVTNHTNHTTLVLPKSSKINQQKRITADF